MEARAISNGRHFMAGLWLLLATVMLSALAPAALVQSTAHGSAFSPATVHVAINASAAAARPAAKRVSPDGDPAPALPTPVLVASAYPIVPQRLAAEPARWPTSADTPDRAAPARARPWPTGPPSA